MNITDLITDRMHENLNPRDISEFEKYRWLVEMIATEHHTNKVKNNHCNHIWRPHLFDELGSCITEYCELCDVSSCFVYDSILLRRIGNEIEFELDTYEEGLSELPKDEIPSLIKWLQIQYNR